MLPPISRAPVASMVAGARSLSPGMLCVPGRFIITTSLNMNTQRKSLTRGFTLPAKALGTLLIGCTLCSCDEHELTPRQKATGIAAYTDARRRVEQHAETVRRTILALKVHTPNIADELTGYKAMWILTRHGSDELQRYTQNTIEENFKLREGCSRIIAQECAAFLLALRESEKALSQALGVPIPSATGSSKVPTPASAARKATAGDAINSDALALHDTLQGQICAELATFIGAEAATRLCLSSGILGTASAFSWSTLGISVGAGILVDTAVRWMMDPSGKIASRLNEALDKVAEEQAARFTQAMQQHLEMRRACWLQALKEQ